MLRLLSFPLVAALCAPGAWAQSPELEKPVSELADLLFRSGRFVEAAALYRRAVELGRQDLAPQAAEAARRAADGDRP